MATTDRSEALARLAALGVTNDLSEVPTATPVEATGEEVYAGGDVARVLVRPAHLSYRDGTDRVYVEAGIGDTVLLSASEAKRLDAASATVEPGADLAQAAAEDGVTTDEQLAAMNAGQVIAHVNQHPEDKARVRALEEARDTPRVTVLKATADEDGEDPEDDADEA